MSCSVQKRKYQNGFYVDWYSKHSKKETYASKKTHKAPVPVAIHDTKQEVASEKIPPLHLRSHEVTRSLKTPAAAPEDSCDVLVFRDGSEIKGKVQEIGTSEIKYKRCDAPDGPTYISKNSDIFMIKYANGTREVIKAEPGPRVQSPEPIRNRPNSTTSQNSDYKQNKYKRQVHPAAIASLVSAIVAHIAVFTLGSFGAVAIFLLPLVLCFVAIATAIVALRKIREQPDMFKGKGMAITGLIIGMVLATILLLILLLALLLLGI